MTTQVLTIIAVILTILAVATGISIILLVIKANSLMEVIKESLAIKSKVAKDTLKRKYSVKDSKDLMAYLVDEAFDIWKIYNYRPEDEGYMTDEDQSNAINYIIKSIMVNMTDSIHDILSIGHNVRVDEENNYLIKAIRDQAKMAVLTYSVKQNMNKDENTPDIKAFK